jgi:hypothetical protein
MSEFQQYQFRKIGEPLSAEAKKEISTWSSRTIPSSHSATFVYHYGDFPKDEQYVVEKYFDMMLYVANWGTRRLLYRLPKDIVDLKAVKAYTYQDDYNSIELIKKDTCYLLDITISEEGGDDGWIGDNEYDLGDFIRLRDDIVAGDYRGLYLLCLNFQYRATANEYNGESDEDEYFDEDGFESFTLPDVPPAMQKLLPVHQALADFFDMDVDLYTVAQKLGENIESTTPDYENLLAKLSDKQKNDFLKRLLSNESQLDIKLKKQLETFLPEHQNNETKFSSPTRLVIQKMVDETCKQRLSRLEAEEKATHIQKMQKLAPQKEKLWKEVKEELELKRGSAYDRATRLLVDLKELAVYENDLELFSIKLANILAQYGKSVAIRSRFQQAKLL